MPDHGRNRTLTLLTNKTIDVVIYLTMFFSANLTKRHLNYLSILNYNVFRIQDLEPTEIQMYFGGFQMTTGIGNHS